jgi:cell division protein FtsW (lipid II flippase)
VSVALGAAYMYAAGAPSYYLLVNFAALAAGLLAASLVRSALVLNQQVAGTFTVAAGLVVLATALVGHGVDGASRWVRIAGISFQPSLILLPLVMVLFAGNRYWLSSIGLLLAAAGLAFQPDRAVAGALTAGLAVQWVYRRDAWVTLSLVGASCGFAGTLVRDDRVPPAPFVEHVVQSAFAFDPLYGLAIVAALVILLIPAIAGFVTETEDVVEHAVFGTTWLALIAFALVGNYPTPLAGYGTSGIVGYCLSSALLVRRRGRHAPE